MKDRVHKLAKERQLGTPAEENEASARQQNSAVTYV